MNALERIVARGGDTASSARRRAERATSRSQGIGSAGAVVLAALGAAAGAAAAFLLDPARGRARRARLIDQSAAFVRRTQRHAGQFVNRVRSDATGRVAALQAEHAPDTRPLDDATLTDRVRSIVFRGPDVPKGTLNVNVERGIVVIRGEVPDEATRERLVADVEGVDGVWSVRDLTHLPGEEAPAVSAS